MSFASRITHIPDIFDKALAQSAVANFGALAPELQALLKGVAGSSPFLRTLIERDQDWLIGALSDNPEAAFDSLIKETSDMEAVGLRRTKRRVALLTALADLGGVWTLEQVTSALTRFADQAVAVLLTRLVEREIQLENLPKSAAFDPQKGSGIFVLAMGKMGAEELNYSSDIDLIAFFEPPQSEGTQTYNFQKTYIRIIRQLAATLSKVTDAGYIFRTDLRLRPNPSVTPVAISTDSAEQYYESEGRNWERAAFIKARAAAGNKAAGEAFLARLTPFIWRRHLDFAMLEDVHNLRQKIRQHRDQSDPKTLAGFNIKLGPGGIRDIEFFAQTLQLIFGGRNPALRSPKTCTALVDLAEANQLPKSATTDLIESYTYHRMLEHRLQMIHDTQTHSLPKTAEAFDQLAALFGTSPDALRTEIGTHLARVQAHIQEHSTAPPTKTHQAPQKEIAVLDRWREHPALRSQRMRDLFPRIAPQIMAGVTKSPSPEHTLNNLDHFMRALPAGVQIFSLFEANPNILNLFIEICALAPALADYLAKNRAGLDMVIEGNAFGPWPASEALAKTLARRFDTITDYEKLLDEARRFKKDWHFCIGLNLMKGYISAADAALRYSDLAQVVLATLWPRIRDEVAQKHPNMEHVEFAVIAMGSLGGMRMTAKSDLDLILIYSDTKNSCEPAPLQRFAVGLTRALISGLSALTAEGALYDIDMRLRPTGRKGPVAISWESYQSYQENDAWVWEHLALASARPVAGDSALKKKFLTHRQALFTKKNDPHQLFCAAADMQARSAAAPIIEPELNLKTGPGSLTDITLLAQTAAVISTAPPTTIQTQIETGVALELWSSNDAKILIEGFTLQNSFLQIQNATGASWKTENTSLYARETGEKTTSALTEKLKTTRTTLARIITRILDTHRDKSKVTNNG